MRALIPVALVVVSTAPGPHATDHTAASTPTVVRRTVPDRDIQPQVAVDQRGTLHLVYFHGDAAHGDVFYARSDNDGDTFSAPIRVNRLSGSAIATGSVRGPHIAVGRNGRVHVAWDGSDATRPNDAPDTNPLLYTRLDGTGSAFEPERNVIQSAYGIDGGTLTADRAGHVYVVWHAATPGERGEAHRRVWIARSSDDGNTFQAERAASGPATGVCGCCALGAFADSESRLYVLYRSAFESVNRNMYLLMSKDAAQHFTSSLVSRWTIGACVMSTQYFRKDRPVCTPAGRPTDRSTSDGSIRARVTSRTSWHRRRRSNAKTPGAGREPRW